ncbi:MAG: polysaccharide deacetylase family protein [Roseburia sp.]|nr:polysaccharide deacetylase family protein [Roseburia sp.]
MNNNDAWFKFIFKILYGICLCLSAMALNTQVQLYAQRSDAPDPPAIQPAAPNDLKRIALTFDDGPHPRYTEKLLDGLKERGVPVTFFVTGEHAELHPDIIRRMHEEGHLIGNHTYSHIQLSATPREQYKNELIKTNEIIQGITGEEVLYVRPPYGSWDKTLESELNMFPVFWNIDPLDWCTANAACVSQAVINSVRENDIILMHDYYESSVEAALTVVDELTRRGYTFVTVDQLLFD